MPSMVAINKALHNFENRIKWRYLFRNGERESSIGRFKNKGATPQCNVSVEPEVNWFNWMVRDTVVKACDTGAAMARTGIICNWSNSTPLVRFARDVLKSSGWVPVVTDKDGGFCLVPQTTIDNLFFAELTSDKYVQLQRSNVVMGAAIKKYK
eukprot:3864376-Karenia_brevis.AAC.1